MSARISLPQDVRPLLAAANELLGESAGYLVGGSLRNVLAGRPLADLDLAVAGDAADFARRLADHLGGHFVLLDDERDIARIALDDRPVRYIDVAALRGDIVTDLALRDFTIDALAGPLAPLAAGQAVDVIDPHGGVDDITGRLVRVVVERALDEDPLRMLRAVRLCAELDFQPEPATADSIHAKASLIHEAAAERQRDELMRTFATPRAGQAIRMLDGLGLLDELFPEVTACRGVTQPKEHYWDVFNHLIEAVANFDFMLELQPPAEPGSAALYRALWQTFEPLPDVRPYLAEELSEGRSRAALLKLAALLHDVAKPETRAPDETGRIRFFGHAERGAEVARDIMRRLRFSRRECQFVEKLVEEHLRPGQLSNEGPPTRRALYRFYRDAGEAATGILLLSLADHLAARGPGLPVEDWADHVGYVAWVMAQPHQQPAIVRPPRLLTGSDLIESLGIQPGPEVGRLLAAIEEAQATGEVTTRDDALEFARKLAPTDRRPALSGSSA